MVIDINSIKLIPNKVSFGFCVYGDPDEKIQAWINYWGLRTDPSGKYTNIYLKEGINLNDLFESPKIYEYGDFFSPNLNKNLHLGHLSNLIIAKSLQSLGIAKKSIAILGDTLEGSVSKEEALSKYNDYCQKFGYRVDELFFASEQKLDPSILYDGDGPYEGTKIFKVGKNRIVGIKSSGATTYFYQDVALASQLKSSTLYITGLEQKQHFAALKEIFPDIKHIGLGLVTVDGKKMSSSEGNVIFLEDILNTVLSKFDNNLELSWNVLCGHILKYDIPSMKDIKLSQIDNVKTSFGLYMSYTLARLKSAGMIANPIKKFSSDWLNFKLLKTRTLVTPNILFEELVEHCRSINQFYIEKRIKDNEENQKFFQPMLDDLILGMKVLGMFEIDKV